MKKLTLVLSIGFFLSVSTFLGAQSKQPIELGTVQWNRDLEKAKVLSAEAGKPIFVQFQEVPG